MQRFHADCSPVLPARASYPNTCVPGPPRGPSRCGRNPGWLAGRQQWRPADVGGRIPPPAVVAGERLRPDAQRPADIGGRVPPWPPPHAKSWGPTPSGRHTSPVGSHHWPASQGRASGAPGARHTLAFGSHHWPSAHCAELHMPASRLVTAATRRKSHHDRREPAGERMCSLEASPMCSMTLWPGSTFTAGHQAAAITAPTATAVSADDKAGLIGLAKVMSVSPGISRLVTRRGFNEEIRRCVTT